MTPEEVERLLETTVERKLRVVLGQPEDDALTGALTARLAEQRVALTARLAEQRVAVAAGDRGTLLADLSLGAG